MRAWLFKISVAGVAAFMCLGVVFTMLVFGVMFASYQKEGKALSFPAASKEVTKKVARKIKQRVYYEATIHNPEGDTLPDGWDDAVLGTLKKIF
jgi:hypothetical protein